MTADVFGGVVVPFAGAVDAFEEAGCVAAGDFFEAPPARTDEFAGIVVDVGRVAGWATAFAATAVAAVVVVVDGREVGSGAGRLGTTAGFASEASGDPDAPT